MEIKIRYARGNVARYNEPWLKISTRSADGSNLKYEYAGSYDQVSQCLVVQAEPPLLVNVGQGYNYTCKYSSYSREQRHYYVDKDGVIYKITSAELAAAMSMAHKLDQFADSLPKRRRHRPA